MLKTERPERYTLRIVTAAAAVFLLLLLAVAPVSAATGDAVQSVSTAAELSDSISDPACEKIIVTKDIGIPKTAASGDKYHPIAQIDRTLEITTGSGGSYTIKNLLLNVTTNGNLTLSGNGTRILTINLEEARR